MTADELKVAKKKIARAETLMNELSAMKAIKWRHIPDAQNDAQNAIPDLGQLLFNAVVHRGLESLITSHEKELADMNLGWPIKQTMKLPASLEANPLLTMPRQSDCGTPVELRDVASAAKVELEQNKYGHGMTGAVYD